MFDTDALEDRHDDETGCKKPMDTSGGAIILNEECELDLVFVLDASSSVRRHGFQIGLNFMKELIRTIGVSKR